VSNLFSKN